MFLFIKIILVTQNTIKLKILFKERQELVMEMEGFLHTSVFKIFIILSICKSFEKEVTSKVDSFFFISALSSFKKRISAVPNSLNYFKNQKQLTVAARNHRTESYFVSFSKYVPRVTLQLYWKIIPGQVFSQTLFDLICNYENEKKWRS